MKITGMQAVFAVILALGLLLSGCQTMSNAVTGMEQLCCNPTTAQQTDANEGLVCANAILAILTAIPSPAQSVASMIVEVGGAATVFKTIQDGGCVLATELSAAMTALEDAEALQPANAAAIAEASARTQVAWPVIPPMPNLHDWVK